MGRMLSLVWGLLALRCSRIPGEMVRGRGALGPELREGPGKGGWPGKGWMAHQPHTLDVCTVGAGQAL